MSAFIYMYRGILLVLSLASTEKRRLTFERWKKTKNHKLVYELGYGVIGLAMIIWLVFWLISLAIRSTSAP